MLNRNADSEPLAAAEAELASVRRSLARRDRRIAYLLALLHETRAAGESTITELSEIIEGLELALLWRAPVDDTPALRRIAQLEARLAAMTALADSLHRREERATA